jgi:hypothetical protein
MIVKGQMGFLLILLLFAFTCVSFGQVRSDFKSVEEYDNFLLKNFGHAFSGDSRVVIQSDQSLVPHVNWWMLLSDSCGNNERGLPDLLSLDEKQRMAIYRMQDAIGRKSSEEGQALMDSLKNATPEEAQMISRDSKLLYSTVDIARLDHQARVDALPELFDKDQQRKLREIASARLQENVNLFVLINKLQLEEEMDLTAEEMKKFRDRLQEAGLSTCFFLALVE